MLHGNDKSRLSKGRPSPIQKSEKDVFNFNMLDILKSGETTFGSSGESGSTGSVFEMAKEPIKAYVLFYQAIQKLNQAATHHY